MSASGSGCSGAWPGALSKAVSAKFAARAQARFGAKRTVWLRAETDGGHGVGTAEDARVAEYADIFAFAWDRSR